MKRITPEMVIDAYIATGLAPCYGSFFNSKGGGCALTAVAKSLNSTFDEVHSSGEQWLECLGICGDGYFWGFVDGFDDKPYGCSDRESLAGHGEGYEDGGAARLAVEAHFAQAPKVQPIMADNNERAACCA